LCCLNTFSSLPLVTHTTGMTHLKVTVCEICALVRLLNDGHKPEKISRCDVKVCNVNQYLASGSPQSHKHTRTERSSVSTLFCHHPPSVFNKPSHHQNPLGLIAGPFEPRVIWGCSVFEQSCVGFMLINILLVK